jgi:hypothetical protein
MAACLEVFMKSLFTLVLLSIALPEGQVILQQKPGLQVLNLDAKREMLREDDWRLSMVSTKPPEIHPTLGRGDRDATDPPNVATLKETRQDTTQRMRDLETISNKRDESKFQMVPVYIFETQMKNTTSKPITKFVWAYHLPESSSVADQRPDQQYLCNVRIEAGETKLVKVASPIRLPRVVDVSAASAPRVWHEPTANDMIINQIQFADNDKWQRADWNPIILTRLGARKLGKSKCLAL